MLSRSGTYDIFFRKPEPTKLIKVEKVHKLSRIQCKQFISERLKSEEQWMMRFPVDHFDIPSLEELEKEDNPNWEPPTIEEQLQYWQMRADKLEEQIMFDDKRIKAENERDALRLRVHSLECQLRQNGIKPRDE